MLACHGRIPHVPSLEADLTSLRPAPAGALERDVCNLHCVQRESRVQQTPEPFREGPELALYRPSRAAPLTWKVQRLPLGLIPRKQWGNYTEATGTSAKSPRWRSSKSWIVRYYA